VRVWIGGQLCEARTTMTAHGLETVLTPVAVDPETTRLCRTYLGGGSVPVADALDELLAEVWRQEAWDRMERRIGLAVSRL